MLAHRGTLELKIGPMFSGKTSWLNGELTKMADRGFKVLKIIHSFDVRDAITNCSNAGSSHSSSDFYLSAKIICCRAQTLTGIDYQKYHVIGIDEGQFFTDLYQFVMQAVERDGKHLLVVGLDGDSFKHKFGQILDIIPLCDKVEKLSATCQLCLAELENSDFKGNILSISGSFTKRLDNSTEQTVIGAGEKYIPVCRFHHS